MNVVITGGASGLGKAIVERLSILEKTRILLSYNNSKDKAEALVSAYDNVSAAHCDFTDAGSISDFCQSIRDFDIDILINNAFCGITSKHFHKMPSETFSHSFNTSVVPTLLITQAMLGYCRKKRKGRIITILTSYLNNLPPTGMSEYVANKAYLLSMHKSWVSENSKFNISSTCISPSFMQTPLNAEVDSRIIDSIKDANPMKKLLNVEEVADTVAFMCTATDHLTGSHIYMNTGENI